MTIQTTDQLTSAQHGVWITEQTLAAGSGYHLALTIRFTDLRERVLALDGFSDDPKSSNESKLEAIQMAWYEEFKDAQ